MNDPHALNLLWRDLRIALDLLIAVLLVFAVVRSLSVTTVIWGVSFAAVYLTGSAASTFMTPKKAVYLWLVVLLLVWTGLAIASTDAAYLAFPLFFVIMHVLDGWPAVISVLITTAVAIAAIAHHTGFNVGGTVGPMLGALVAIVVGFGFRLLQRETKARSLAIDELVAARADVAAMSRRAGELDERARLAADIHDTVAQGLSSIQLLLYSVEKTMQKQNITDEALVQKIELARTTAADNLAETRRIIHALQPAVLEGSTIVAALTKVARSTPMGDAITLVVDGQPQTLPPNVETILVRVAQSSVANVVKHAHATACTVTLTFHPDEVRLDIVDNGTTFDMDDVSNSSGMGIAGATRRLEAIGGTFSVDAQPGGGCGVSARIPL